MGAPKAAPKRAARPPSGSALRTGAHRWQSVAREPTEFILVAQPAYNIVCRGPIQPPHPAIGQPCALCDTRFVSGDSPSLIPTGPADKVEAKAARAGVNYMARATFVHYACNEPPDDDNGD